MPEMASSWAESSIGSQVPRRRTRRLVGKRRKSICETRKTFEVKADSSMMGMLEV